MSDIIIIVDSVSGPYDYKRRRLHSMSHNRYYSIVKVITRVVTNVTRVVTHITCEISDRRHVVKDIRRVRTNITLDLKYMYDQILLM